jgi:hypothetical protein
VEPLTHTNLVRLAQQHLEALGDAAADLGLRIELQQDSLNLVTLARLAAEVEALGGRLAALQAKLPAELNLPSGSGQWQTPAAEWHL